MLGDFKYSNPTKLYFGERALENLPGELAKYGRNVVLVYGGGSIKRNGIYDAVTKILEEAGKRVAEIPGVMPNPTSEKLEEGAKIARAHKADFLLAVGGGSVCDYTKALAVSVHCEGDLWEKYFARFEEPDCEVVPLGCVLTMAGTGSEMNTGAVITNPKTKEKRGHSFKSESVLPKFSILNPKFTYSLPHRQMVAGIYDIFNHICEQYFSGEDDNVSDDLSEALMRSVVRSGRRAHLEPENYEARSNIMWAATWALNDLLACGKGEDWMVHSLGEAVGGYTNATHGMTLSAVSLAYYRHVLPFGLAKFKRFAVNVWNVKPEDKTDTEVALEGLRQMEAWMRELGLAMNLSEFGVKREMLEDIADLTLMRRGGYKTLNRAEVIQVFEESL